MRCGACHEVFDGNAGLVAPEALAAALPGNAGAPQPEPPAPATPAGEAAAPTHASMPHADTLTDQSPYDAPEAAPQPPADASAPHEDAEAVAATAQAEAPQTPSTQAGDAAAAEPEAAAPAPTEPSASAAFDAEMVVIEAKVAQAESEARAAQPVYTLDFDTTFDPFGILPKAPEPAPDLAPDLHLDEEPAPTPAASEPQPAGTADLPAEAATAAAAPDHADAAIPLADIEEIDALPPPRGDDELDDTLDGDSAPTHAPPPGDDFPHDFQHADASAHAASADLGVPSNSMLLRAPSAPAAEPAPARVAPSLAVTVIPKAPAADPDEPDFVRRSRLAEEAGRTRRMLMGGGAGVLALLLLVQATFTFHNQLAAQLPALKPALASACSLLGCRIDLPAQVEQLTIESGDMQTLGPGTFKLTTLLTNKSGVAQAWPNIELTLHDDADKPLLRRVITPADYLPPGSVPARGFAPRAEQPVVLYFETGQLSADGYHLDIFYP